MLAIVSLECHQGGLAMNRGTEFVFIGSGRNPILEHALCATLTAWFAVSAVPAEAQSERMPGNTPGTPKYTVVHDIGRFSCGLWLEVRNNRGNPHDLRHTQAQEWISGFITAYNYYIL